MTRTEALELLKPASDVLNHNEAEREEQATRFLDIINGMEEDSLSDDYEDTADYRQGWNDALRYAEDEYSTVYLKRKNA